MPDASPKNSEWLTRKQFIDKRLTDAGWRIVPENKFDFSKPLRSYDRCAIEEYVTINGPADYALCADGKLLGVVEAKKLTLGPQNALSQAERYAKGLTGKPFDFRGYGVPFLYSTNGEVIWHHDIRHQLNRSREIAHFHRPDALIEFLGQDCDHFVQAVGGAPRWKAAENKAREGRSDRNSDHNSLNGVRNAT